MLDPVRSHFYHHKEIPILIFYKMPYKFESFPCHLIDSFQDVIFFSASKVIYIQDITFRDLFDLIL